LKKRKTTKKKVEEGPSILELLDRVEAEMGRLRAEVSRLKPPAVTKARTAKPPALGKGLSQLFGGKRADDHGPI
jgi:hypothetical protein